MGDQPVEVVGDVARMSFASARAMPMVRMNRPNLFLLVGEDMFEMGTDRRFRGIARAIFCGIDLPAGLR